MITYVEGDINHCLRDLRKLVEDEGVGSLALPRLATGVGGLDWSDVQPLLETHLATLAIPVIVYARYVPGQAAVEALSPTR
jgi:O-acetyl-ADP-ribose deacetylase (regulator of RNase III)